jgi:hypothetical protein
MAGRSGAAAIGSRAGAKAAMTLLARLLLTWAATSATSTVRTGAAMFVLGILAGWVLPGRHEWGADLRGDRSAQELQGADRRQHRRLAKQSLHRRRGAQLA